MRALLAIVPLVLAAGLASAQDGASVLARLESSDEEVSDAAEDEWDELDEATQVRLARAALADPDAPGALAAASRVSPWCLDLDEMSRQARALLRDPEIDISEHSLPACIGMPEVPEVWRVAAGRTGWLEELHRVTGVDSLPALLDQAADAPDAQWTARIWNVRIVAWHSDAHRDRVAALVADDLLRVPEIALPRPARDGSGLSAYNLVTPEALVRVLRHMHDGAFAAEFRSAMAEPGEEGSTLERRLQGLEGRVFAKTGTISNVNSLSGYLVRENGQDVIFSILTNGSGLPASFVRSAIDDILTAIAR